MSIKSNKQLKSFYKNSLSKFTQIQPQCVHFGDCGGCALQNISYADQVALKQRALTEIFSSLLENEQIGTENKAKLESAIANLQVTGAPQEFYYRHKMDYAVTHDPIKPPTHRFGLRRVKSFNQVVDLSECHLIPATWFRKLRELFNSALDQGFVPFDLVKHTGDLAYLVIRQAGDKAMLQIITRAKGESSAAILAALEPKIFSLAEQALSQDFISVYWLNNATESDISSGEIVKVFGEQYLWAEINFQGEKYEFPVGHSTFWQNNVAAFEQILHRIADHLQSDFSEKTLLDLYCGVGSIGIPLASKFKQVIGTEINPESIELTSVAAARNGVINYTGFLGDAAAFTAFLSDKSLASDDLVAIVDPPRTGLMPAGVNEVLLVKPAHLFYVSCNPITQAEDLAALLQHYDLIHLEGFDMFPQTLHCESLAILRLKA